jgi:hypothetical protein
MLPNMKAQTCILPLLIGCAATLAAGPQAGSPKGDSPAKPDHYVRLAQEKGASRLMAFEAPRETPKEPQTFSSLDRPDARADQAVLARGKLQFEEVDGLQVLKVYQELSGRSVVRANPLPAVSISFQNETPLNRREALQVLDTIPLGTKLVKAVPSEKVATEAAPVIDMPADQLPESSSYMVYVVQLKNRRPTEVAPALQPFARMPNSVVALKDPGILVLRDYSSNIRRMLQIIERIDQAEPAQ